MTEEEISVREKIVVEVLNDAAFGNRIEVDQHVATEDDVKALHEGHAAIVGKIEATERDAVANRRLNLQLFPRRGEVLLAVIRRQIARAVRAIDRILGMC